MPRYCPVCSREHPSSAQWCLACGSILDPSFPPEVLPPEVAGSLEIVRELLVLEVRQGWLEWLYLPLLGVVGGLFLIGADLAGSAVDGTMLTILLLGGFTPIVATLLAWYFLLPRLERRFWPTRVRFGLNERGILVYHVDKWTGFHTALKLNLAAFDQVRAEVRAQRGGPKISLWVERGGTVENLLPYQAFGGKLPRNALRLKELVEALQRGGPVEPDALPSDLGKAPAPFRNAAFLDWKRRRDERAEEAKRP